MITIGGVDYSAYLERRTLTLNNVLNSQPDTGEFQLITGASKPAVGAEVVITDAASNRIFGGILTSVVELPRGRGYQCGISDYRVKADRYVLNDRFVSMTAGAIVKALFAKYAPEFDTSNVYTGGQVIASIRFKRNSYLTGAMQKLSQLTGYIWDIDYTKKVVFTPPNLNSSPISLTDTSFNFQDLSIVVRREQLRNHIIIRGGKYPSTNPTIDYFTGDGLSLNFRLSKVPFGIDKYIVFREDFAGNIDPAVWIETDVTNPTPPPGHLGSDGYLFTTIQAGASLSQSGWLQVVGGNSTWGGVRLQRFLSETRVTSTNALKRFEMDVSVTDASTQGRFGLWDPSNLNSLIGEQYGVYFNAGTLVPSEGGVSKTPAASITVANGKTFRIRIVPKVGSGAKTYINTDDTGDLLLPADQRIPWRPSQWQLLYDSNAGSLANLTVTPIFNYNFNGRVDRVRVYNQLYNITLTVGGVSKTVGLLGADDDSGCDALVGINNVEVPVLAFFGDTKPAASAAIVLTYYEALPVFVQAKDNVSIAAIAAIESNDGVYQAYIEDATLETRELAYARATTELEQYANPEITVSFTTRSTGVAAGQKLSIAVTAANGSGHDYTGSVLINAVTIKSLGSDNYEYTVTAGAHLKGIEDYIYELIQAGKPADPVDDDNAVIDGLVYGSDEITFTDLGVIEVASAGPYTYADSLSDLSFILLEDGVSKLLQENGSDHLLLAVPAQYGLSEYTE